MAVTRAISLTVLVFSTIFCWLNSFDSQVRQFLAANTYGLRSPLDDPCVDATWDENDVCRPPYDTTDNSCDWTGCETRDPDYADGEEDPGINVPKCPDPGILYKDVANDYFIEFGPSDTHQVVWDDDQIICTMPQFCNLAPAVDNEYCERAELGESGHCENDTLPLSNLLCRKCESRLPATQVELEYVVLHSTYSTFIYEIPCEIIEAR